MNNQNQEIPEKNSSPEPPKWYYLLVLVLVILSLVTVNRDQAGAWEITLGIRETTPILIALALLPFLLRFLVGKTKRGVAEIPGVGKFSWENISEIDKDIADKQKKHAVAGEAAKIPTKNGGGPEKIDQVEDIDLEKAVTPQELPLVKQVYLQKFNGLVKDFNRNRHLRSSGKSTIAEADDIAYKMRSMAPLLFDQFDISAWLESPSLGKQLAAVKYLDWVQDIEFAETLAIRLLELERKGDTFQSYHVLLALNSMANQLSFDYKDKIKKLLEQYIPSGAGDSSRAYLKDNILKILS
ncbi:MAG: hypothetical protein OER87_17725 [Gammaproteobacteria bacterium]|nr:hypothetical protein [Gammaproteobacteria bacterium]MDH3537586.1 hypothetical protein [Gammaproteobacteria bacterium]